MSCFCGLYQRLCYWSSLVFHILVEGDHGGTKGESRGTRAILRDKEMSSYTGSQQILLSDSLICVTSLANMVA